MKSVAVAALAGVAAAATGPAAPMGTGASTTASIPIPTSTGNPAPGFQLRGISTKAEVNGLMAAEKHSTDSGKTEIVLARDAADNKLMMSQMTLTPEGMLRVDAPLRKGGSEADYWTVGEIDPNTGMAAPQVVPAGMGKGFYLRNTTAVPTPGQSSVAVTPFPINTAPTTMQTVTTTTTVAQFPQKKAHQRRQAAALPQFLGYKDAQGREAQFYACTGLDASNPSGPTGTAPGTGRPTGTGAPFPVRPAEVGPETRVSGTGHASGTGVATGTASFPTSTGVPAEVQQLMFGFGTQPVPKTCAPVFLQTVHQ